VQALVCHEYGSAEALSLEHHADPLPGPGELVIAVAAAGINFPDLLAIAGKYQVRTPPPFIPGNEASGTVVATGADVSEFAVGDKVIVTTRGGAFAELCRASAAMTTRLPQGMDFVLAAGFAVTRSTALYALQRAAIRPGESLLVLGAGGGVGTAAVEVGKALGARVIAAASTARKLEFASAAGADELIDYSVTALRDVVQDLTAGSGVNVVIDPVGGSVADAALRSLARRGRYLVVGFASGDIPAIAANIVLLKEASILGVWWGNWCAQDPRGQQQNMHLLSSWYEAGKLSPQVPECYPFDDFKTAFAAVAGRRALGKLVLQISPAAASSSV